MVERVLNSVHCLLEDDCIEQSRINMTMYTLFSLLLVNLPDCHFRARMDKSITTTRKEPMELLGLNKTGRGTSQRGIL